MTEIDKDFENYIKEFQKFDKQMSSTEFKFSKDTKDKWNKFLAFYQIKLAEQQIKTTKSYNRWFIGLTIAIILLTITEIIIKFVWKI